MKKITIAVISIASVCSTTLAKVDLVTLPARDTVQLTIYNSADMTLVRENRALTFKEGLNKLQFSWANTLIDPTSLEMFPKQNADKIEIQELIYPPRVRNLGLWNIQSEISGKSKMEISYLTSGLSWRAFYMGTLTPDESKLRLQGYVRVSNNSGEDYENAQTRLIVGKVNLIDQIASLARREYPYGKPVLPYVVGYGGKMRMAKSVMADMTDRSLMESSDNMLFAAAPMATKEIEKKGLSEYFLYTIEGTETIPNGWSKRLPSFDVADVPVVNLYKYEEERYGQQVIRFLSFNNDEKHELGETPIPGGDMRVFRHTGEDSHLSFEGRSSFKYIPVDEEVELNLGSVENVIVEPKLMKYATDRFTYDHRGNISGWDEIRDFKVEVRNTRPVAVELEIKRNFNNNYWKLKKDGDYGEFTKDDKDTVIFTLKLPVESKQEFTYQLTTHHGENQR